MSTRDFQFNTPGDYGTVKITRKDMSIYAMLHGFCVVHYAMINNIIELSTGGWKTRTTRMAINTALSQIESFKRFRLIEENGKLILTNNDQSFDFKDGIRLTYMNGQVILL